MQSQVDLHKKPKRYPESVSAPIFSRQVLFSGFIIHETLSIYFWGFKGNAQASFSKAKLISAVTIRK